MEVWAFVNDRADLASGLWLVPEATARLAGRLPRAGCVWTD